MCVHVRRWKLSELPEDDEGLRNFCLKIWQEKDELLEYYTKNGCFPGGIVNLPIDYVPMKS